MRRVIRSTRTFVFLLVASGSMLAVLPVGAAPPGGGGTVPYEILDRVEGPWIGLNVFPVRPMVQLPGQPGLWSVNTHASTIERFVSGQPAPQDVVRVPWGPVGIGEWKNTSTGVRELLVACRGNHVFARIDSQTLRTLEVSKLPHEPGDLLVMGTTAFVSCQGAGAVVQIDLVTGARTEYTLATHPTFRCKEPLFLSPDGAGGVYVAPLLSGNDSTARRIELRRASEVIDLADPTIAVVGLPDEDLFRIDPVGHTVAPVARATGTILAAHGVHPSTGKLWQLSLESLNKDPARQTEATIRGNFVENRLAIVTPAAVSPLPEPEAIVNLDDADAGTPGVQIDPALTVGRPFALAFTTDGRAFVAGLTTDNVTELDASGARVAEVDLPDGSIPRGLLVDETAGRLYVHCWGSNEVRVLDLATLASVEAHVLTPDPSPALVQLGRKLFYDASRSQHNNATCGSCHVEGKTDRLVWDLSDAPRDEKGPLATQTMTALERIAPFHWRGERTGLERFNAAFFGLMGGKPLRRDEFRAFEAFVFSMQAPAGLYQNRERIVDDSILPPGIPPGASAIAGQFEYFNTLMVGGRTCNSCHTMPIGSNGDIFGGEQSSPRPKRTFFKTVPFHENWRKVQPDVDVEIYVDPADPGMGTVIQKRALLGSGVTHSGLIETFLQRIGDFPVDEADVSAYVLQADQGLAPVVHWAFLLDASTLATVQPELENYLMPQAVARNCDVVVFGEIDSGGPLELTWAWDRQTGLFVPDSSTESTRTLADFVTNVANESNVFAALPVGMGETFTIDRDLDGLVNAQDAAPDTPFVDPGDTAAPAFTRTPEVLWNTLKVGRVAFETDEPTVYRIRYETSVGDPLFAPYSPNGDAVSETFSKTHVVTIGGLLPSTDVPDPNYPAVWFDYSVMVEAFDRAGNVQSFVIPTLLRTAPFGPGPADEVIVGELFWTNFDDRDPSDVAARAQLRVDYKRGGPPAVPKEGDLVVARVLVDGEISTTFVPDDARTFRADRIRATSPGIQTVMEVEGPFLVAYLTNDNGIATFAFRQPGLVRGQEITLNLEGIFSIAPADRPQLDANLATVTACVEQIGPFDADCDGDGTNECCQLDVPVFYAGRAFAHWSLPDTLEANRALRERVDPQRPTRQPVPKRFP